MATLHSKIKVFTSPTPSALTPPDGTSLEEQVTAFLATLAQNNVLDVIVDFSSTGKYGQNTTYMATVVYQA